MKNSEGFQSIRSWLDRFPFRYFLGRTEGNHETPRISSALAEFCTGQLLSTSAEPYEYNLPRVLLGRNRFLKTLSSRGWQRYDGRFGAELIQSVSF